MRVKHTTILKLLGALISTVLLGLILSSCTSLTKVVDREKVSVEIDKTTDSSSYWKDKYNGLLFISTEEKNQLSSAFQFQSDNQEALLDAFMQVKYLLYNAGYENDSLSQKIKKVFDSLRSSPCKSSLEIDHKGNLKATGLKSANLEFSQLRRQIAQLIEERETEISKRMQIEDQLKIALNTKTVDKTRRPMIGWFIFIGLVCYVLGAVYPPKKAWAHLKLLIIKKPTV